MSSVLTKTLISGAVGFATPGNSIADLQSALGFFCYNGYLSYQTNFSKTAFCLTYGAMVAKDIYDTLKGEIKTITSINEAGNLTSSEYKVYEIDWIKYVANVIPAVAAVECHILDQINNTSSNELMKDFFAAGIAIEIAADALNWHPTDTIAFEINGDGSNDFSMI